MLFAELTSVIAKFGMKEIFSDTAAAIRTAVIFTIEIANGFFLCTLTRNYSSRQVKTWPS
ncbi:hypothetical protein SAMN05444008_101175 [Cnuella takakiae]|uniref:Uncharacterized protein n=1 Tax=Cnuella takakiae TaxID=1302690 RepID=A0A1M4SME7_9BACT|nr:hypothetical protein SAMN05444008_101175 [Cnuella takakiae]